MGKPALRVKDGAENSAALLRCRGPVSEVEARRPRLAFVGRLLAELAYRPIGIPAVRHSNQRTAPFAGDHHRGAIPAAGENDPRALRIDPELLPLLLCGDIDAEAAAGLVVQRHP